MLECSLGKVKYPEKAPIILIKADSLMAKVAIVIEEWLQVVFVKQSDLFELIKFAEENFQTLLEKALVKATTVDEKVWSPG